MLPRTGEVEHGVGVRLLPRRSDVTPPLAVLEHQGAQQCTRVGALP
jgi:hypothetical protein